MPPLSRRKGVLGFAKQSVVGTPATVPASGGLGKAATVASTSTFALPIVSGGLKPTHDRADLPTTRASNARPGQYTQRARGGGTVTVLCYPDAFGLLAYSVMGAQSNAAITGPPATTEHMFIMNDALPVSTPLTFWSLVGDDWWRFTDSFVNKLTLRGTSGENLLVEMDVTAFITQHLVAADFPAYTLKDTAADRYKYIGSVVKLDADAIPTTTITNVENFMLEIDRAPVYRYGSQLQPSIMVPERMVNFSSGLTYDPTQQGWDFLLGAYTNDVAAATSLGLDQDFKSGGFYVQSGRHPNDSFRGLYIASGPLSGTPAIPAATAANWDYGIERPDADPGGGPIEYDLAGVVRDPGAGGSEINISLFNDLTGNY